MHAECGSILVRDRVQLPGHDWTPVLNQGQGGTVFLSKTEIPHSN